MKASQNKRLNMPADKPIIAACYCRTSREDKRKTTENVSIEQQVEDAKKLAVERGWLLPDSNIFKDADRSSTLPPQQFKPTARKVREKLTALIELLESADHPDVVIVRKRDRLFRSTRWTLDFYDILKRKKIGIRATSESMPDSTDGMGIFTVTILAAAAELELDKTRSNARDTQQYLIAHGRKRGPVFTPGYRDIKGGSEPDPIASPVIEEIYKRCVAGESVCDITRWLNAEHLELRRGKGGSTWAANSVYQILTNPIYIGLTRDGTKTQTLYAKILSVDLWKEVQKIMDGRRGSRQPRRQRHRYLLSGLLRCGYCGKAMTVVNSGTVNDRERRYYGCNHSEIPHETYPFLMGEAKWVDLIRGWFLDRAYYVTISEQSSTANIQMEQLDKQLEELAGLFATRKLSATAYASATTEAEIERGKLKAEAIISTKVATKTPAEQDWNALNEDERRDFLRKCVGSIAVFRFEAVVEEHSGFKIRFPLLKQKQWAKRPANCLQPDGFKGGDHLLLEMDGRLLTEDDDGNPIEPKPDANRIDWTGHLPEGVTLAEKT